MAAKAVQKRISTAHSFQLLNNKKGNRMIDRSLSAAFRNFLAPYLASPAYDWEISEKTWGKLATGFQPASFPTPVERNFGLKRHIADRWKCASDIEKNRLATWIVADWGGIKANSVATIRQYVSLADEGQPDTPHKGVASYSKILAFTAPHRFAIYDARVVASLNAIQVMISSDAKMFFPYLLGRNSKIEGNKSKIGFKNLAKRSVLSARGFVPVPRNSA
jgi:hypothetical protein